MPAVARVAVDGDDSFSGLHESFNGLHEWGGQT